MMAAERSVTQQDEVLERERLERACLGLGLSWCAFGILSAVGAYAFGSWLLALTSATAFLLLGLLWRLGSRLRDALDRTRAANAELREARASLAEARAREQRILASTIPQQVWTALPDGRLDFVNQRAREYFQCPGAGPEASDGPAGGDPHLYLRRVLHPDDLAPCLKRWIRALATGEGYETEARLRRADGAWRWHLIRALAVRGVQGRIVKWFGTNTDIHEQKQALLALRASEERAWLADRRKDEFLAMLGHELRNPLAPILNSLELLRKREQGALGREYAIIDRQVRYVVRLVDDLLDVARITRGKIKLSKQPLELALVVDQAMETSRPLIEQRRHQVTVSVPRQGLLVEADPVRLAQVLANLITNAAKYTDAGGRISVTANEEGDAVEVHVRDNGRGISAEHLPHLFELFRQGDQPVERSLGGLGIGLTLVRMLVELHGGSVTAASEGPGQGSEFTVRLPLLPCAVARSEVLVPARSPGRRAGGRRILVVDDNADAAQVLAEWLELSGHSVRVADDGPVALSLASEFAPEVVLLDIGLPSMDGFEVARRLRAAGREGPRLRLIALTGFAQEADRERARAAGFDEHLVKPVELKALTAMLARIAGPREEDPPHAGA